MLLFVIYLYGTYNKRKQYDKSSNYWGNKQASVDKFLSTMVFGSPPLPKQSGSLAAYYSLSFVPYILLHSIICRTQFWH